MPDNDTQKRPLSGFQRRKLRQARGLPRYSPGEAATRRRKDVVRAQRAYALNRVLIDTLKLERGCMDCGYNAHPAALDFDHLPGSIKIDGLARFAARWAGHEAAIRAEIAKCEVVCANCHRIRTATRRSA